MYAYRGESFSANLGEIVDDQSEKVTVDVDFGIFTPYLTYDRTNSMLTIEEGATDKLEPSIENIVITLTDDNPSAPLAKLYNI